MLVALGLPCYQTYEFDMVGSVIELLQDWPSETARQMREFGSVSIAAIPCRSQPVQLTRNAIVDAARKIKADVLLWQDSDIAVTSDHAVRLVRSLLDAPDDVALVAAPCVLQESGGSFKTNVWPEGRPVSQTHPFEVGAAGFGLVAMRMSAFDAIGAPWFRFVLEQGKLIGEDLDVCLRLRAVGLKLLCDPRVTPDHVFRRSFGYGRDLSLLKGLTK